MFVPAMSSFSSSFDPVSLAGWESLEKEGEEVVGNSVEDTCSFLVPAAVFKGLKEAGSSLKCGRVRF